MEQLEKLYGQLVSNPTGFVNLYFWDLLVGAIALILLYAFAHPDEEGKKKKNWIGILTTLVAYSIFFFARHKNIHFTGFNFGEINIDWFKMMITFIFVPFTIVYHMFFLRKVLPDDKTEWPDNKTKIQSIISFYTFMLSILVIILFGFYWMIIITLLSYFLACIYIVPIRRRWVITMFKKPFFASWISVYKAKKIIIDPKINTPSVNSKDSLFLDNGLNIIFLASWLPGFSLIPLDYVRTEERFQTEQLPTNDPEDKDTAGGTLSIDYKIWFKMNYWPKNFLKLDDDDRNDLNNVIKRIIDAELAERISKVDGLNRAMTMDAKDKDDEERVGGKKFLRSIISPKTFINLKNKVLENTGALLTEIKILDRNPDEEIQKEQNKLTVTRTQIEEAKLQKKLQEELGVAEGAKVVAQLRSIQKALATSDDTKEGGPTVLEMDGALDSAVSLFTILKTMESNNKIILPAGLIDKLGSVLSN